MEKTKTIFCGSDWINNQGGLSDFELICYANLHNEIYISISSGPLPEDSQFICLDRLTAIKLVKHLKLQISKLEVGNV